ncbi:MAG: hypothetical protein RLZZ501_879 [Pseudomonadota bacterium]|jgi:hypothetical protein
MDRPGAGVTLRAPRRVGRRPIPRPWRRSLLPWALAASLLLHAALVLVSYERLRRPPPLPPEEQMVEVDLAPPPPAPPAPAAAPAPPAPPTPPTRPQPPLMTSKTPPPPPQLKRARPAERSASPQGHNDPRPASPGVLGIGPLGGARGGAVRGELSQSAQDFLQAQILRMWHYDFSPLRGRGVVISAVIEIDRDGTLLGGMNRAAPWNPGAVIPGYERMPDSPVRRALESYLLALRMAQPLTLPPDDGKGWPRRMVLRFAIDSL